MTIRFNLPFSTSRARRNTCTWSPFTAVMRRYSDFDGIGFVFTEDDPFFGLDLDHCTDEVGTISGDALVILRRLDTYAERSVSGEGVHAIGLGTVPNGGNKRGDVEMYSSGRYFTFTGHHVDGMPTQIRDRQAQLNAIHAEISRRTATIPI